MARRRSPARLVIALSVAAALAIFLVYTALAGGTPVAAAQPGRGPRRARERRRQGRRPADGRAQEPGGLRFTIRDVEGTATLPVVYKGSVPDLFKTGRDVSVEGSLQNGVFVAGQARDEVPVEVHEQAFLMPGLGSAALVVAFGLVVYAAVAGGYAAYRGRRRLLESATNALYAAFGSVLLAAIVLLAALARHDFSFAYVASHTSRELPLGYTLASFWSGQEGSLLLWLLVLTGWARPPSP